MSTLDQIHESIDAHIAELHREIAALEAARAALRGERPDVTKSVAARPNPPTRRRRASAKPASNGNAVAAAAALGDAVVSPVIAVTPVATVSPVPTPSPLARTRAGAKPARSGKSFEVLLAGKLEAMLSQSDDGLSAITISKRSNAGYGQVLGLLRELESSGRVRRSGTRRTSLWRVVTDEERIAERAAELEALSAAKSPA